MLKAQRNSQRTAAGQPSHYGTKALLAARNSSPRRARVPAAVPRRRRDDGAPRGPSAGLPALAAPRGARLRLRKQARPRRRAPRPRRGQELHAALRRGAGVRRARRALPGLQAVLPRRGHADAGVPADGGARGGGRRHRRVAPRALARRHPGRRAHARLRARRHALAAEARRPGRVRSRRFRAPTRARRRRTRRSSTAPTCRS